MALLDRVSDNIATTMAALSEPQARTLPEIVIHCDYHPGNLKFTSEAVTGLFDFDWSKIDLRVFDLGLALWYFCTSWQGSEDGRFRLDWARTFLRAYQETLAAHPEASSLSPAEAHYLPVMINAGNLYVLNWTILDYFAKDVDPQEYLVFLDHSLNFTLWYEDEENRRGLESVTFSLP
jgi:homoserine kinase type II